MISIDEIKKAAKSAACELCDSAGLKPGQVVIAGCSTSEIIGKRVGTCGSLELGEAVFGALYEVFKEEGVHLAAQCCEHLNRAIIVEQDAAAGYELVNVIPRVHAGGAFAAAAWALMSEPIAIEEIRADAGLDIGGTLIGMHLKKVAIPLRLNMTHIGMAAVSAARTRPKLIGGIRTEYNERLL